MKLTVSVGNFYKVKTLARSGVRVNSRDYTKRSIFMNYIYLFS